MDDKFLQLLRCPITGDGLRLVDTNMLDLAIKAQQMGQLCDRLGRRVDAFSGGLTDLNARWFYPTRSSIPNLIPDQAIEVSQISNSQANSSQTEST